MAEEVPFTTFGEGVHRGMPNWWWYVARRQIAKRRVVSREIIGLKSADLIHDAGTVAGGRTNDLTETVFDVTTRTDAARFLLTNNTGNQRALLDIGIKGKPVLRLSGADGFVHDSFIDYESVEKNGEIKLKIDNDFIVTKIQVEKIADFWHKEGRQRKHYYELTLVGTQYNFEIAEWYTLDLNYTLMGKDEFIDSLVSVEAISIERTFDGIGTTSLILKEEEANWVFDANSPARFLSGGSHNRSVRPDVITVGASTYIGPADLLCDGTADQAEIQDAIDMMATRSGGIVRLTEGQFNITATLIIYGNIKLQGMGINTIIEKNCNDHGITLSSIDNIFLENFKITRNATDTDGTKDLIYGSSANNIFIKEIIFEDSYRYSMKTTQCNNVNIIDCEFSGNTQDDDISIGGFTGITYTASIINNYIHNSNKRAIVCYYLRNSVVSKNKIINSGTNGTHAIKLDYCDYVTVEGNTVDNFRGTAIDVNAGQSNILRGNTLFNNHFYSAGIVNINCMGIRLDSSATAPQDTSVIGNTAYDNGNIVDHASCDFNQPHIYNDGASTSGGTWAENAGPP